ERVGVDDMKSKQTQRSDAGGHIEASYLDFAGEALLAGMTRAGDRAAHRSHPARRGLPGVPQRLPPTDALRRAGAGGYASPGTRSMLVGGNGALVMTPINRVSGMVTPLVKGQLSRYQSVCPLLCRLCLRLASQQAQQGRLAFPHLPGAGVDRQQALRSLQPLLRSDLRLGWPLELGEGFGLGEPGPHWIGVQGHRLLCR